MSEKPTTFSSFEEAFGESGKPLEKKEKKDNTGLGGMLLQQMELLAEKEEEEERMLPEDFLLKAIEVGWKNNPNRRPGEFAMWGPTIVDAFGLYFGGKEDFEKVLARVMKSGKVGYIPEKRGKGYMLKIAKQE